LLTHPFEAKGVLRIPRWQGKCLIIEHHHRWQRGVERQGSLACSIVDKSLLGRRPHRCLKYGRARRGSRRTARQPPDSFAGLHARGQKRAAVPPKSDAWLGGHRCHQKLRVVSQHWRLCDFGPPAGSKTAFRCAARHGSVTKFVLLVGVRVTTEAWLGLASSDGDSPVAKTKENDCTAVFKLRCRVLDSTACQPFHCESVLGNGTSRMSPVSLTTHGPRGILDAVSACIISRQDPCSDACNCGRATWNRLPFVAYSTVPEEAYVDAAAARNVRLHLRLELTIDQALGAFHLPLIRCSYRTVQRGMVMLGEPAVSASATIRWWSCVPVLSPAGHQIEFHPLGRNVCTFVEEYFERG
jgi:hypothetical protein